jgi:hypothetical protein
LTRRRRQKASTCANARTRSTHGTIRLQRSGERPGCLPLFCFARHKYTERELAVSQHDDNFRNQQSPTCHGHCHTLRPKIILEVLSTDKTQWQYTRAASFARLVAANENRITFHRPEFAGISPDPAGNRHKNLTTAIISGEQKRQSQFRFRPALAETLSAHWLQSMG